MTETLNRKTTPYAEFMSAPGQPTCILLRAHAILEEYRYCISDVPKALERVLKDKERGVSVVHATAAKDSLIQTLIQVHTHYKKCIDRTHVPNDTSIQMLAADLSRVQARWDDLIGYLNPEDVFIIERDAIELSIAQTNREVRDFLDKLADTSQKKEPFFVPPAFRGMWSQVERALDEMERSRPRAFALRRSGAPDPLDEYRNACHAFKHAWESFRVSVLILTRIDEILKRLEERPLPPNATILYSVTDPTTKDLPAKLRALKRHLEQIVTESSFELHRDIIAEAEKVITETDEFISSKGSLPTQKAA